jgi:hypothetical protein
VESEVEGGAVRGDCLLPQTHSSCPGYRLRKLSSGIREEIDDAIATELGHPESLSKAVELKDIGWALAGIAVDAVGPTMKGSPRPRFASDTATGAPRSRTFRVREGVS